MNSDQRWRLASVLGFLFLWRLDEVSYWVAPTALDWVVQLLVIPAALGALFFFVDRTWGAKIPAPLFNAFPNLVFVFLFGNIRILAFRIPGHIGLPLLLFKQSLLVCRLGLTRLS